jgi:hypothetical protein
MLRAAAALGVAVASAVALCPSTAQAGDGGPVQVKGNNDGVVSTTVEDPGQSGSSSTDTTTVSDVHSSCVWMQVFTFEQLPLPPKVARQAGGWWQQYCNNNGWAGMPVFVPDGSAPAAALQTSPATLAQRAVNQLRLPAPTAGLNPTPRALVNLAEWFWVPRSAWTTLSQRTQAGAVWAVVVARPTSTTWDPGDGSAPFTCAGAGTPYVKDESAASQHSDCTYTYRRSSANEPQSGPNPNDRFFTVTVTTTWSVSWTGAGGTGGALPQMTRTSTFRLAVAERDAVVTGGSG